MTAATEVVIAGCGGHGREAFALIHAINQVAPRWQVCGFVDDKPAAVNLARLDRLGAAYLGPIDWLAELPAHTRLVIAIADPRQRRAVAERVRRYRLPSASLVHPAASIGSDADIGEGLLAFAGARVTTNVTIGRYVHLNQNVTIGHDSVLGDFVSVNPLAAVSGECHVETGALIGTTAAVLQGLRVGTGATVGAGACVVRNVPPWSVVKGVPAR
jgi:sugar O-acyltransferase (sialic acid O-acetyltransferase NeuD family)